MQIEQTSDGDLLELTVSGALDNESSVHFRAAVDERVRDGWHRILVHMPGVRYISSAGINVLIVTKKRLEQLQGQFGISALTPEVEGVLAQTKLLDLLRRDPEQMRATPTPGDVTRSLPSRIAREDGLDLQIFALDNDASSRCRVVGDPRPLFESMFTEGDSHPVEFAGRTFALGLGALGADDSSAAARSGEFLAVAGAAAQSAQSRRSLPDYSLSQGEFTPRAQVLYGLQCEGEFSRLIRFDPVESGAPVGVSTVAALCLRESGRPLAGVVMLAESAGLLGAHLRRSPTADAADAVDRFGFPEVRDWLSFSPERVYARHLVLMVGILGAAGSCAATPSLDAMLRPIDANAELFGHFHAAVFPYRPLKKRTLDLHNSIRGLFESGLIQDVLHLLRDDRAIAGVGESELLGGACWVSPISDIVTGEGHS